MKKIKIIVACGGGIFTTTVVTDKIQELLRKNKIPFLITPSKITEIPKLTGADLIVVTGKTEAKNQSNIPVLIGLPLFTGVGPRNFHRCF
ncbi:PTS sorbitol IIB subunit [Anoxybacterium hadale]|uniref:PTS sorbitol IIB subunit n=1 Tax=Anoxybacterium hadale TaxID=3408580 RepID=UPI003AFF7503